MNLSLLASTLFWAVFQPGHFLLLCLILGLVLLFWGPLKWAKALLSFAIIMFAVLAFTPLSEWLIQPLESRFSPYHNNIGPAPVAGIIVLAGAEKASLSTTHQQLVLDNAAERLIMAAQLGKQYPDALIIHTGGLAGRAPSDNPHWRENDVARTFFAGTDLNPQRIFYDDSAYNTYTNALGVKAIWRRIPKRQGQWLLVTSAFHMPRAMGAFRAAGLDVRPYPVDYRSNGGRMLFSFSRLHETLEVADMAMHEWVGLVVYYMTDRSDSLFPAP